MEFSKEEEAAWRAELQRHKKEHEAKDVISFPDEPPPPPEIWEVKPKYDWEEVERGYIFEERLEDAEEHKRIGNEHFAKEEWSIALRRYRRAIYFCHFDEMQMHDFMDKHKDQAIEIQMHCKLNLVACVVKMYDLEDCELPDGSLDHAVEAISDVLAKRPKEAKAHFRRGQVLMLQADLPGARGALAEAKRLGGHGGDMVRALSQLKALEQEERERARALYGGKIQKTSLHKEQEAQMAKARARRDALMGVVRILSFPITAPAMLIHRVATRGWAAALHWWRRVYGNAGGSAAESAGMRGASGSAKKHQ